MHIPVSEAKAQLTDLVRRAEAGDEVILTRRGEPTVRLVPVVTDAVREQRAHALKQALDFGRQRKPDGGADAARSQDWLYDESGLPT